MIRMADVFHNAKIVHALRAQLGWTHFRALIAIDDPLKRDFYAEMCRIERWSTHTRRQDPRHAVRAHGDLAKTGAAYFGECSAESASIARYSAAFSGFFHAS